jgi:hypothetical protein
MRHSSNLQWLLLVSTSIAFFGACGNGDDASPTPSPLVTSGARVEGVVGQPIIVGDRQVTISSVRDPASPPPGEQAPSGTRLVAIDIAVKNVSGEPWAYRTQDVVGIEADGKKVYKPNLLQGTTLAGGELSPGEEQTGQVIFSVPEDERLASVRFKLLLEEELIIIRIPE